VAQVTYVALSIWPVIIGRALAEDVAGPSAAGRVVVVSPGRSTSPPDAAAGKLTRFHSPPPFARFESAI
jgi:hypothetical protein